MGSLRWRHVRKELHMRIPKNRTMHILPKNMPETYSRHRPFNEEQNVYESGTLPRNIPLKYGGFPKLGVPFGGPNNKDYSILGSILGSPYFGKLPYPPNPSIEGNQEGPLIRVQGLRRISSGSASGPFCLISLSPGTPRCKVRSMIIMVAAWFGILTTLLITAQVQ